MSLTLRGAQCALLALFVSASVQAQDARSWLAHAFGNAELRAELSGEGAKASFFCANCHGEDGNSRIGEVPNLAGQHPVYLVEQIDAFIKGHRKDPFMEGLMKLLNEREKAAIALFYADARALPAVAKPGPRAAEGEGHHARLCANCHRPDAYGAESFPRLAGQQPEYLRISLMRYLTMSGERIYPPMTGAVQQLGERNIQAVIQYYSSLE